MFRKVSGVVLVWLGFLIMNSTLLDARQLAFPTAEGGGCYTIGGRGGAVYEVTNLNDRGPGSLREAVAAYGPRTVVFRVSGTIELQSDLKINNAYITIAGQTAPGDGICIRGYEVVVNAIQVVIRYLRFRLGDETGVDTDSIWGRYRRHIIIDHCSASWSEDETMSFYGNDSMTVQWCLISESLYMSNHPKGAHGYGGIWGGRDVTFHHNLLAHHSSRNPRFAGGETPACVNVDFRNNVIYNWGFNSAYGGEGGRINMVSNYYKAGPATKSSVRNRIIQISDRDSQWFVEGNYVAGYPTITADNWAGGVQGYTTGTTVRADSSFPYIPIASQSAEDAYYLVLEDAGANYPFRDPVDERIIGDVRNGTATYDGYFYEIKQGFSDTSVVRGIIDSQADVGGWPELHSLPAPADSDHDGMPDYWELSHGLNPNDDADRNLVNTDGYTRLEEYLDDMIGSGQTAIAEYQATASGFQVMQNYPNPFNPNTTILFSLPEPGKVDIRIYDITGRLVSELLSEYRPAGSHSIRWSGKNNRGQETSAGIYLGELRFGDTRKMIKMNLIR